MNIFSVSILIALVWKFIVELVAQLLNLKALKPELPPELTGVYKQDEYRKSQEYIRATTRFSIVQNSFTLLILLAFWFARGFNYLDQIIRAWQSVPLVDGVLYIGILFSAYSLLSLPFDIYGTFVIEERFGFNRTTPRTFFMDHIKAIGLGILFGVPVLAGTLALFEHAGPTAWLYCWAAAVVLSLAVQYVAPIWIMPLFNKFTPMESGELKNAILNYASSVNFPIKNVFVMDSSRRTGKANAMFTGFGRNKRVVLFDTLIEQQTVPEIVAVLAHEIGHYKKKHIVQGTIIGILHTGVLLFLFSLFLKSPGLYQAFYMNQPSVYAGLVFFALLYTPVEMVLSIGMQAISRKNEYAADRFAAETVKEPESLVTGLKKLHAKNLSNLSPHPLFVFLNYSHPPLIQRIHAMQRIKRSDLPA